MVEVSEKDIRDAAYFLVASRRLSKKMLERDTEAIAKVVSAIHTEEVRELGDIEETVKEVRKLKSLGMESKVYELAEAWRRSRDLHG